MPKGDERHEHESGSLATTVVRGASLSGLGYFLAQALTLGAYLLLARLATPSDFGDFAAGSVLVGVALLISDTGMMAALVQRRDRIEEAAATAVFSTFAAGLGFALLALALSPLVGLFFGNDEVGAIAAAMSGIVLLRSLDAVPSAILQRRFSFLRRTVVEPASALAFGVAAVIATSKGMGAWGLVIGQYAFAATEVALSWGVTRWRPQLHLASFEMWRELVAYGRHVLLASMIGRVGEQADTIWLGRFIGSASLGQYRYALRLATTPFQALMAAASYVLFPAFSRISGERERFESGFMRSLRWFCVLGFPAGLIMIPLGEPLAVLLFGEVWREAGQATAAMCLFCGGSCLGSMAGEALKAYGTTSKLTTMHTFTTLVTAGLMGALLPFGLEGVAAGLSLGAVIGGAFSLQVVHRAIGFSRGDMWAQIWPAVAASLVMAGAMVLLDSEVDAADRSGFEAALIILGEGLVAIGIYGVVLRLFAPSLMDELKGGLSTAWSRLGGGRGANEIPDLPATAPAELSRGAPAFGPHTELSDVPRSVAPRFSVVIAAYNARETLGPAIDSVLGQTVDDLEVIVIDDGSSDDTAKVAHAYEANDRRVFVYDQPNAGPSAARNRGIRFSRGRLVAFLDSDDLMMPDYLARMSEALEADSRNGMAFTDGWSFDHKTKKIHLTSAMSGSSPPDDPPSEHDELYRLLIWKNFMLSSAMVRREVLIEVGGYDESMRFAEDYDLWLRIVGAGYLAARGPGRRVIQREREDSLSKDDVSMLAALRDLLLRIAADPNTPPAISELARERSDYWGRELAASSGQGVVRATVLRARRVAGRAKRLAGRERAAFEEPPSEVAAAFPDLERL